MSHTGIDPELARSLWPSPQLSTPTEPDTEEEQRLKSIRLRMQKTLAEFCGFAYYPFNNNNGEVPGWKSHPKATEFQKSNNIFLGNREAYLCRNHTGLMFDQLLERQELVFKVLQKKGVPFEVKFNPDRMTYQVKIGRSLYESQAEHQSPKEAIFLAQYYYAEKVMR